MKYNTIKGDDINIVNLSDHSVDIDMLYDKSIVFDVGSYQGDFVRDLLKYYSCYVYMYEPNVRQKTIESKYGNIDKINIIYKAISSEEGIKKLYLGNKAGPGWTKQTGSSFYSSKDYTGDKYLNVPCVTLEKELDKHNIKTLDLLKLDVEGEELNIIENINTDVLKRINQMTIEFHSHSNIDGYTEDRVEKCREKIKDAGFKEVVKSNLDNLYIKEELYDR
jgi:FkbM family methyltransferase